MNVQEKGVGQGGRRSLLGRQLPCMTLPDLHAARNLQQPRMLSARQRPAGRLHSRPQQCLQRETGTAEG